MTNKDEEREEEEQRRMKWKTNTKVKQEDQEVLKIQILIPHNMLPTWTPQQNKLLFFLHVGSVK